MNAPTANSTISIDVISEAAAFEALAEQWNSLLQQSGLINPFLRHEWLTSWWRGYGAEKSLLILRFKREEQTIGFAPLMIHRVKLTGMPLTAVGFLCNHWTRMDFILIKEYARDCLSEFTHWIRQQNRVLILAQMENSGENYITLKSTLESQRIAFTETEKKHAFIPLTNTWEAYLQSQSKNFRMDSRRKLKRLQESGEVKLVSSSSDLDSLNKIKAIAQNCWQNKAAVNIISTSSGETFYRAVIDAWQNSGLLDFSIVTVNDTPISYMMGIKYHGCYFAFDTAFDPQYEKFSPGLILHNLLLEKLYQQGITRFDFGFVAEYKKRWSEETLAVCDLTVYPNSTMGFFLGGLNRLKRLQKPKAPAPA
jgi:CelD/BcsL family acetyltransferase involved in cellulose biosynthesis